MTGPRAKPSHTADLPDVTHAFDISLRLDAKNRIVDVSVRDPSIRARDVRGWIGHDLTELVTQESVEKVLRIVEQARREGQSDACELNHSLGSGDMAIRYSAVTWGDGSVVMLGHNLAIVAELQSRLVRAQMSLEREFERVRAVETRYRMLFETTPDPLVMLSADGLRVLDANGRAAEIFGRGAAELVDASFPSLFEPAAGREITEALRGLDSTATVAIDGARTRSDVDVVLRAQVFRAGPDRLVLVRLSRDGQGRASDEALTRGLDAFYDRSGDGIVFTDARGIVRRVNRACLALLEAVTEATVVGKPFGDFLARPLVDMNVMMSNALENGRLATYSTHLMAPFNRKIAVEISATYLSGLPDAEFAFVIRDVSRLEITREASGPVSTEAVENLVELVGSAPLKDLVRSTTDVVEKMCIETALNLTGNNRAAAAEMLALSRQSLYVKLRKYGLLSAEENDVANDNGPTN